MQRTGPRNQLKTPLTSSTTFARIMSTNESYNSKVECENKLQSQTLKEALPAVLYHDDGRRC